MFKKILLLKIILVLNSSWLYADFESFKLDHEKNLKSYNLLNNKEFEDYKKEIDKAFEEYKSDAYKIWGKDRAVFSNKTNLVVYKKKMTTKSVIDFEKGVVKLEIVIPVNGRDKKEIKKILQNELYDFIRLRPDKRLLVDIYKDPDNREVSLKDEPVLTGQLEGLDSIDDRSVKEFSSNLLQNKRYEAGKVKGQDDKVRDVVSIEFPLIKDHLEKRVKKYLKIVLSESKKRKLKPQLILAVIETESSFNPYAKSPIPAFGLMQLVPYTAGRDSYRLVFKKDKAPTEKFLYDPKNNIELGAAYFYILFNRYLDEINNMNSRMWCAAAAYNTGIGNIFKTFIGKYSKAKYKTRQNWKLAAFDKINQMTSKEVYDHLVNKLPYKETKNYIKKIKKRMPRYEY